MPYSSMIDRTDGAALIPEEVSDSIIQALPTTSIVMQLAQRFPNMSRKQERLPVLGTFPTAYWQNGDTGLIQTTEMSWENVYLNAEVLGVIVSVPKTVLADEDYDLWGQTRPRLIEAFAKAFDRAVLHGTNAPDAFPDDLMTQITAASHTVDEDTATYADLYDMLLGTASDGTAGVAGLVEADGFMVNGYIAAPSMKARMRGLRDANGNPIFQSSPQEATRYTLDGEQVYFPTNGALNQSSALMIAGDWKQLIYSMRTDMEFELSTQAVIQNASGAIEINTFQQNVVALKATMRLAWALPNPPTLLNETDATRLPFAALIP